MRCIYYAFERYVSLFLLKIKFLVFILLINVIPIESKEIIYKRWRIILLYKESPIEKSARPIFTKLHTYLYIYTYIVYHIHMI